jgi:ferrous iron transport protein A
MPLSMVSSGEAVKVQAINGPHAMQIRLVNLGILPGVSVRILNHDSSSLLLKIKNTRLMLHRSIASLVQVQ